MLHSLKLLLPALLPSWNFFDIIAPSPRIHYALTASTGEQVQDWQLFRPLPDRVSFLQMLARMLWNPQWNESLFMLSCAERLLEVPTRHSEDEILKRIANVILHETKPPLEKTCLQFRLLLVRREDGVLQQELVYASRIVPLSDYANRDDDA